MMVMSVQTCMHTITQTTFMYMRACIDVLGERGASWLCREAEVFPSGVGAFPGVLLCHCLSDQQVFTCPTHR